MARARRNRWVGLGALLVLSGCVLERYEASRGERGAAEYPGGAGHSGAPLGVGGAGAGSASGGTAGTDGGAGEWTIAAAGAAGRGTVSRGGAAGELNVGGTGGAVTLCTEADTSGAPHGRVEELGNGRVRLSYDFEEERQLCDFRIPSPRSTVVTRRDGRLVVIYDGNITEYDDLASVEYVYPLRVTAVRFLAEVLSGTHINLYLATSWSGTWNPDPGYGCILNGSGRMFVIDGEFLYPSTTPVVFEHVFEYDVSLSATTLDWMLDGVRESATGRDFYQGKDRFLALGGFESSVAFDELVIEGELGP